MVFLRYACNEKMIARYRCSPLKLNLLLRNAGDEVGPRSRASQDLVRVSIRGSRVEVSTCTLCLTISLCLLHTAFQHIKAETANGFCADPWRGNRRATFQQQADPPSGLQLGLPQQTQPLMVQNFGGQGGCNSGPGDNRALAPPS